MTKRKRNPGKHHLWFMAGKALKAGSKWVNKKRKHTHTGTNKKDEDGDSNDQHSSVLKRSLRLSLGHKFNKHCRDSESLRYLETTYFVNTSVTGKQYVGEVCFANTVSQIMIGEAEGSAAAITNIQGGVGLMELNPNQKPTGSSYLVAANSFIRNDMLFNSNLCIDLDITNCSTASCILDLYFVTPNTHTNLLPSESWTNAILSAKNGQTVMTQPTVGVNTAQVGYPLITTAGMTPPPNFNKAWKILKKLSVALGGGSCESIHSNINTNYMLDTAKISMLQNLTNPDTAVTNANITNNFLRHGTVAVMAVWRGQVGINDSAADYPTYSPVQIGMVVRKKYTFKMVSGNQSRQDGSTAYAQVAVTGTPKIFDIQDVAGIVESLF